MKITKKNNHVQTYDNENLKPNVPRVLSFVGFLDLLGVSIIIPQLARRAKVLGASPIFIGIIGSSYGAVQLFSSPGVGSWSDTHGRRRVLIICLLATSLSYFFLPTPSLASILFARIIAGFFKHSQSISQAYLADVIPPSENAVEFGNFGATSNLGFILGPTIGGHLAEFPTGFYWNCTIAGTIFLLNSVIVWKYLPNQTTAKNKKCSVSNPVPGFLQRYRNLNLRRYWDLLLLRFFLSFAALAFRSNFSLLMEQKYELSPKNIGYIISYQGMIGTISGFLVGHVIKLFKDDSKQLTWGSACLLVSLMGITLAPTVPFLLISLTLLSMSTSFLRVSMTKVVVSNSPKDQVGTMMGFSQTITSTSRMLSPLIAGAALEFSDDGAGILGITLAALGLLLSLYMRYFKLKSKIN